MRRGAVGRARLPTFADYLHLPYICAMVKEVLRWRTTGPLGVAHLYTEDGWYEGMFIPNGTICIPNMWHMANNSLFINIAVTLWAIKIERKKDASGQFLPLDLDGWIDVGVVVLLDFHHIAPLRGRLRGCFCRRPVPFKLEVTPRFPEASAMLAQEREMWEIRA